MASTEEIRTDLADIVNKLITAPAAEWDEGMLLLSQGRPTKRLVEETRNFKSNTLTIKGF